MDYNYLRIDVCGSVVFALDAFVRCRGMDTKPIFTYVIRLSFWLSLR